MACKGKDRAATLGYGPHRHTLRHAVYNTRMAVTTGLPNLIAPANDVLIGVLVQPSALLAKVTIGDDVVAATGL